MKQIMINAAIPKMQNDVKLNQAAPVQNTWYTVLDTISYIRVIALFWIIKTTGEDLDVEITIDGRVFTSSGAHVADTEYHGIWAISDGALELGAKTTSLTDGRNFFFDCRTFKMRIRKTTANGAGNLVASVHYQKF